MDKKQILQEADRLKSKIAASGKLDPEVLKKINYRLRLDWNYHSNRMEGGTLTREETRSVMIGNIDIAGKPLKDVFEMDGHDKVILSILSIGKGEKRISESRIKEIHASIMHEEDHDKKALIGTWKKEPNTLINYKNEKLPFTQPLDVPEAVHKLLDKINADLDALFAGRKAPHAIEIAAAFHVGFLSIHPFYDGNGRTARILTNLILIACGFPAIIIKEAHKKFYYKLLSDIQAYGGALDLLVTFLAERTMESQQIVLDAIEGKDITQPDDLEKELQQIDLKLKNEEAKVVKRTPELVLNTYEQSIKPLFNALYERLTKFNAFFADFEIHTFMDGRGNSGTKEIVDTVLPEYFKRDGVREITITFQWGGFNRAGANTFWLSAQIKIQLDNFDYRINEQQIPEPKPGLKKLYSQQLTDLEIAKISDEISSDTLLKLKQSYKQVTGKEL